MSDFGPGSVIEHRYRILQVAVNGSDSPHLGETLQGGRAVGLVLVPPAVAPALRRAVLLGHPNLAPLLEVVARPAGYALAVFAAAPGRTLAELLAAEGQLEPRRAAAICAAIGDALAALHQRGAAHGLLRPASVIVEPGEGRVAILAYAPPAPAPQAYQSPERGTGSPSPADDVWALAATLHEMLVGVPPPALGYSSRSSLVRAGIQDPGMATLLANCLARRPEQRVTMVAPVRDALIAFRPSLAPAPLPPSSTPAWMAPAGKVSSSRPPSPPSSRPRVAPSPAPLRPSDAAGEGPHPAGAPSPSLADPVASRAGGGRRAVAPLVGGIALVAVGLIAAIVWGASLGRGARRATGDGEVNAASVAERAALVAAPQVARSEEDGVAAADGSAADGAAPGGAAIDLTGGRVIAAQSLPSDGDIAACVVRLTPAGAFAEPPKVAWLCEGTDPRLGYQKMRGVLVRGARGRLTDGMVMWSRLRWYGMAGVALLRGACCGETPAFALPKTSGCDDTAAILDEVASVAASRGDLAPVVERYTKSVTCHSFAGRALHFGLDSPLGGGEAATYEALVDRFLASP